MEIFLADKTHFCHKTIQYICFASLINALIHMKLFKRHALTILSFDFVFSSHIDLQSVRKFILTVIVTQMQRKGV